MSDDQATTFEAALAALDDIVRRLETGDVGLEEAVALFEEGRRHLASCRERLTAVKGRIDELTAEDLAAGAPDADDETPFSN